VHITLKNASFFAHHFKAHELSRQSTAACPQLERRTHALRPIDQLPMSVHCTALERFDNLPNLQRICSIDLRPTSTIIIP